MPPSIIAPGPSDEGNADGDCLAAAREWVRSLPPGTAFWYTDIPAALRNPPICLTDIVDDAWQVACRVEGDLCWRTSNGDLPALADLRRQPARAAIAYAGAGAGFAGCSAVRRLRWTTQIPARTLIATLAGAPQLTVAGIAYGAPSRNRRRDALNWAEVTLLEALLHADLIEVGPSYDYEPHPPPRRQAAWAEALGRLASGESTRYLGGDVALRVDVVTEVAAQEEGYDDTLHLRLRDVAEILNPDGNQPDLVSTASAKLEAS